MYSLSDDYRKHQNILSNLQKAHKKAGPISQTAINAQINEQQRILDQIQKLQHKQQKEDNRLVRQQISTQSILQQQVQREQLLIEQNKQLEKQLLIENQQYQQLLEQQKLQKIEDIKKLASEKLIQYKYKYQQQDLNTVNDKIKKYLKKHTQQSIFKKLISNPTESDLNEEAKNKFQILQQVKEQKVKTIEQAIQMSNTIRLQQEANDIQKQKEIIKQVQQREKQLKEDQEQKRFLIYEQEQNDKEFQQRLQANLDSIDRIQDDYENRLIDKTDYQKKFDEYNQNIDDYKQNYIQKKSRQFEFIDDYNQRINIDQQNLNISLLQDNNNYNNLVKQNNIHELSQQIIDEASQFKQSPFDTSQFSLQTQQKQVQLHNLASAVNQSNNELNQLKRTVRTIDFKPEAVSANYMNKINDILLQQGNIRQDLNQTSTGFQASLWTPLQHQQEQERLLNQFQKQLDQKWIKKEINDKLEQQQQEYNLNQKQIIENYNKNNQEKMEDNNRYAYHQLNEAPSEQIQPENVIQQQEIPVQEAVVQPEQPSAESKFKLQESIHNLIHAQNEQAKNVLREKIERVNAQKDDLNLKNQALLTFKQSTDLKSSAKVKKGINFSKFQSVDDENPAIRQIESMANYSYYKQGMSAIDQESFQKQENAKKLTVSIQQLTRGSKLRALPYSAKLSSVEVKQKDITPFYEQIRSNPEYDNYKAQFYQNLADNDVMHGQDFGTKRMYEDYILSTRNIAKGYQHISEMQKNRLTSELDGQLTFSQDFEQQRVGRQMLHQQLANLELPRIHKYNELESNIKIDWEYKPIEGQYPQGYNRLSNGYLTQQLDAHNYLNFQQTQKRIKSNEYISPFHRQHVERHGQTNMPLLQIPNTALVHNHLIKQQEQLLTGEDRPQLLQAYPLY